MPRIEIEPMTSKTDVELRDYRITNPLGREMISLIEQVWPDAKGDVEVAFRNGTLWQQYTSNPDEPAPAIMITGYTTEGGRFENLNRVFRGIWTSCMHAGLFNYSEVIDVKFWIPNDDGVMSLVWKRLTEDGVEDSSRVAEPAETEAEITES